MGGKRPMYNPANVSRREGRSMTLNKPEGPLAIDLKNLTQEYWSLIR